MNHLHRAELLISNVLRGGAILCAAVIGLGLVLSWTAPRTGSFAPATLHQLLAVEKASEPVAMQSLAPVFEGLKTFDPGSIVALGVMLLIALPIVRVALSVGIFVVERDYIYVAITLIVLTILLSGLFLGKTL